MKRYILIYLVGFAFCHSVFAWSIRPDGYEGPGILKRYEGSQYASYWDGENVGAKVRLFYYCSMEDSPTGNVINKTLGWLKCLLKMAVFIMIISVLRSKLRSSI